MTTATATISPAAKIFLLPSHHHHHHHHALVETPVPSPTPSPQSSEEAVAEVEAEVEQFRRQLYLRRGLSYPGPKTAIAVPRQNMTVAARQQYSSDELPSRKTVGLSPVVTASVITGVTATVASTAAVVELKAEPSSSSASPSPTPRSSSSSSSITTTSAHTSSGGNSADNNTRVPKTFSQLMEDLIRTHSSTASPSGQKYSTDLLQGTIGHYKDAMFGGGTYFGSFT